MKVTQVTINRQLDTGEMVDIYNEVLLNPKEN